MGTRTYFSRMSKEDYEELRKVRTTNDQTFDEMYELVEPYLKTEVVYELGKYVNDPDGLKPIFEDDRLVELFDSESGFKLANADTIKHFIDKYRSAAAKTYQSLMDEVTLLGASKESIYHFLDERFRAWDSSLDQIYSPLRLKPENRENKRFSDNRITDSWSYEYAVFELVRVYNEFDWENDVLIYHWG